MSIQSLFSLKKSDAEAESLTPHVINQRTKQLLFGYITFGYLKMRLTTENSVLCPSMEGTKRQFDAKVRDWRVRLHEFDMATTTFQTSEHLNKILEEVRAEISKCELSNQLRSDIDQTLQINAQVILAELPKTFSSKQSYVESATSGETSQSLSTPNSDDGFTDLVEDYWFQEKSSSIYSANCTLVSNLWDHGSIWKS